jgi:hypothetical protein
MKRWMMMTLILMLSIHLAGCANQQNGDNQGEMQGLNALDTNGNHMGNRLNGQGDLGMHSNDPLSATGAGDQRNTDMNALTSVIQDHVLIVGNHIFIADSQRSDQRQGGEQTSSEGRLDQVGEISGDILGTARNADEETNFNQPPDHTGEMKWYRVSDPAAVQAMLRIKLHLARMDDEELATNLASDLEALIQASEQESAGSATR